MAIVEIRDHALWAKHIHGDNSLKRRIEALTEGDLIELEVDGVRGMWERMKDGKDGRPMPGIKALGVARKAWHALQNRRGEIVEIRLP